MTVFVVWQGEDAWRVEAAQVHVHGGHLLATGTQIGSDPLPYRLTYSLDTGPGFVTRRLSVEAVGAGWSRFVDLSRDEDGAWAILRESAGQVDLPTTSDAPDLTGAVDCDLGRSPVTNSMPVLRHRLHEQPGDVTFAMAWVSVPDLRVLRSEQRYTHVTVDARGRVVRYEGLHRGYVDELAFDDDGIVVHYPGLARRVTGTSLIDVRGAQERTTGR